MKIYTKTGDEGTTGILGSKRLRKDDARIEAYGTVDELNAAIGVARAHALEATEDELAARIQDDLFTLGAALADPNPEGPFHNQINDEHIAALEKAIDDRVAELAPMRSFILPGGAPAAAQLHLTRTVCRRAERLVVHLANLADEHVPSPVLIYLNRLSDLLFVMARTVNHHAGVPDVPWISKK
ncbi:cob(I)yrinic acid a,c-diamide adenosyltransferase [Paludisphaera rhizosphaerae]|uniref:cob(I)yrinic acid a,c-diamide adenosyltransferase n=1 Tax=Paludisphaera rhizosphaerae TaxID=2711216 RepID=UPI0013EAD282|nr:cob(I)yrinic acid a,c-diamide adenosyltransferase [Paludisphaera rhizosphaerae]